MCWTDSGLPIAKLSTLLYNEDLFTCMREFSFWDFHDDHQFRPPMNDWSDQPAIDRSEDLSSNPALHGAGLKNIMYVTRRRVRSLARDSLFPKWQTQPPSQPRPCRNTHGAVCDSRQIRQDLWIHRMDVLWIGNHNAVEWLYSAHPISNVRKDAQETLPLKHITLAHCHGAMYFLFEIIAPCRFGVRYRGLSISFILSRVSSLRYRSPGHNAAEHLVFQFGLKSRKFPVYAITLSLVQDAHQVYTHPPDTWMGPLAEHRRRYL